MLDLGAFAERVRDYCLATGGSVTSWGRTPARNARVGGVPTSYHLHFLAVDVAYDAVPGVSVRERFAERCGLKLVIEGDHDHLQPAE